MYVCNNIIQYSPGAAPKQGFFSSLQLQDIARYLGEASWWLEPATLQKETAAR